MNNIKNISFNHQRRIAKISISSSSFRSQGKSGLIAHTQNWLTENVDLKEFEQALKNKTYASYLDKQTVRMRDSAKKYKCKWGTARKGLNIFFRDILYNSYFFNELDLTFDYGWQLEIPLDSKTMKKIRDKHIAHKLHRKGLSMPEISTIIALQEENSLIYQNAASEIAKIEYPGFTRVDLDMEFWTEE